MADNTCTARRGPSRVYRSELRRQQAAQTRRRILEAAVELFGQRGYQGTTFAQLAERAGVSVETVQKHGPKSALIWAAIELAAFGVEGETDVRNTDLGHAMRRTGDAQEFAAFVGAAIRAVNEPAAAVWTAFTAAAGGDPELRVLLSDRLAAIRRQDEYVLSFAADQGWLRTDVPFDELVQAFCVITAPENFVRFVQLDGGSPEGYAAFIERTVRDTILAG